ncbi:MAG: hypothetical protein H0X53_09235 [Sphingomonas sp.]|nr:hypothetical protein [Sphingomonas sp.]
MPLYLISAAENDRRVDLATCDTAMLALKKLRDARSRYRRAWVTYHNGADVSEADLAWAADRENERT